jgi:nicotinamide mononucleotide adenylyltransferase
MSITITTTITRQINNNTIPITIMHHNHCINEYNTQYTQNNSQSQSPHSLGHTATHNTTGQTTYNNTQLAATEHHNKLLQGNIQATSVTSTTTSPE